MYEFLGIDTKALDNGVFQFYQTVLIRKALEATGMGNCNGLTSPTNVDAPIGTYNNVSESNIDWLK